MTTRLRVLHHWLNPAEEVDWEAVYRGLLPKVYNYFRYRVGDGPLAEDLTAATFERAWRKREKYRRDQAAFSTWLFTIARHTAADYFRSAASQETSLEALDLPSGEDTPEETAEQRETAQRLSRLLQTLSPRERELAALKYGAELTNRAIAQQTGLSESNVGTILHRVIERLRTEWEADL